MTEVQLAYIAGLFDGEGHCRIVTAKASKNGARYYRAHAMIYNTDRRCLDYAKDALGFGWVGLNDRRGCFKWQAANAKAIKFLKLIRPYVKIKCEQIDKVLAGPYRGRVL